MMNMNDLRVEQEIAQERYRRLIREREVERLVGPQPSLAKTTLAALGRGMVRLGHALQARYDTQPCCA